MALRTDNLYIVGIMKDLFGQIGRKNHDVSEPYMVTCSRDGIILYLKSIIYDQDALISYFETSLENSLKKHRTNGRNGTHTITRGDCAFNRAIVSLNFVFNVDDKYQYTFGLFGEEYSDVRTLHCSITNIERSSCAVC